jgi:hypothetical protein
MAVGFLGGTPALFPDPGINQAVTPSDDVLEWINPDPNDLGDIITCDVWFRASPTPLADPNLVPDQPGAEKIVSNEVISSVDLSELPSPITLQSDYYYYWKVNVIDPNDGGPIAIDGFTWSFNTGDTPPEPNAGPDQYIWLDMEDGDLDPTQVTFSLNGLITDDGKSEVTTQWSLNYSEQDPATVVTIQNPTDTFTAAGNTAVSTNVTIDGMGYYEFLLEADDAVGHGEDTVVVIVYGSACEAAQEDPDDIATTYPNGHGDIDGDCDTDLADFALLAGSWMECMSDKLDCAP